MLAALLQQARAHKQAEQLLQQQRRKVCGGGGEGQWMGERGRPVWWGGRGAGLEGLGGEL